MYRRIARALIALAAILAAAIPAAAQITTGTVAGTITDPQHGVVPGATVVLTSESRGTKLAPVVTSATGDYVIPNVTADTYTVEVSMPGFKTSSRKGVRVSGGDRAVIPTIELETGNVTETVAVTAERPIIQAQSGERSFAIVTSEVENLPINGAAGRNFAALAVGAPGVITGTQSGQAATRIGGGGQNNVMMDGVSVMDTGNNGQMLSLNPDAIAEIKVLTSGYQAEYGRSSGLQITAVTKSGTNKFRGSAYDIRRNSDWNANSWANIQNGIAKTVSKQNDYGFTVGGPIGKPGGENKLFFFFADEYRPRLSGGGINRLRVPTELERAGNFSQTLDNNGNLFNTIKNPNSTLACTSANTGANPGGCFADQGVLGKIPASAFYAPGFNLINNFVPVPNHVQVAGETWNLQTTQPTVHNLTYQPAIRVDYQLSQKLRFTSKYDGQNARIVTAPGSVPGYNDQINEFPAIHALSATVDYSLTPTMFLEATYGLSQNKIVNGGVISTPFGNRLTDGLADLPVLFPNSGIMNPKYYEYGATAASPQSFFNNGNITMPPQFTWGGRINNGIPSLNYPSFFNINRTQDLSISLTKVAGHHTMKAGFYLNHSYKAQNQGNAFQGSLNFSNDTLNTLDTGFGYANALVGVFDVYSQNSQFIEGGWIANNIEGFMQDNWKVNSKMTLDFGLRLVDQQPQYDQFQQNSNFFPDKWSASAAPVLYLPGCVGNVFPCSGNNRQALDPRTGLLQGPGSSAAIAQVIPGSGSLSNGVLQAGQGISKYDYLWPTLSLAPRVGAAYDLSGNQKFVLRGNFGVFYDRPDGNTVFGTVGNPPVNVSTTVRYGQLQDLANPNLLKTNGVSSLQMYRYNNDSLPTSLQWTVGAQMALPGATALDVSYVGQHGYNQLIAEQNGNSVNVNAIDLGTYLNTAATTDKTTGTALDNNLLRPFRGYNAINQQWQTAYTTFHSIQTNISRRFRGGLSANANYTLTLSQTNNQNLQVRLDHAADGTYTVRQDQATYEALNSIPNDFRRHVIKMNAVWDMPDIHGATGGAMKVAALVLNDWQLSAIFTGGSGPRYSNGFSYQNGSNTNQALTGSPDYGARLVINGDTGSGCSSNQYAQFNVAAFQAPAIGSLGLESGRNYLIGCSDHTIDAALARNFRLGGGRNFQVRLEAFNLFNNVIYNGRNGTVQFSTPTNSTVINPQFNADGSLVSTRLTPSTAGFGAASGAQAARTMQLQLRFQF